MVKFAVPFRAHFHFILPSAQKSYAVNASARSVFLNHPRRSVRVL